MGWSLVGKIRGNDGSQGIQGIQGIAGTSFDIQDPTTLTLSSLQKSGTAFQPRAGGPCLINIKSSLTGLLNVTGTVVISTSATQNGVYTEVARFGLTVNVAGVGVADSGTGSLPVKAGRWVKVVVSGLTLGNVATDCIIWNI